MIVVTGATGRTGKMATETLLAKGEKVRAVGETGKSSHRWWSKVRKHSSATWGTWLQ